MPTIDFSTTSLSIYAIVAITVITLGTWFSRPGSMRAIVFATLFTLFFGLGILIGHGIMPFPGLWILVSCLNARCIKAMGGLDTLLLLTLAPMVMQWVIVLAISFAVFQRQYRWLSIGLSLALLLSVIIGWQFLATGEA